MYVSVVTRCKTSFSIPVESGSCFLVTLIFSELKSLTNSSDALIDEDQILG